MVLQNVMNIFASVACYEYLTRECSALWGEPVRATEVCSRFSSTVENGALSFVFRRTRSFAWCRDSVIGERFEVHVRA